MHLTAIFTILCLSSASALPRPGGGQSVPAPLQPLSIPGRLSPAHSSSGSLDETPLEKKARVWREDFATERSKELVLLLKAYYLEQHRECEALEVLDRSKGKGREVFRAVPPAYAKARLDLVVAMQKATLSWWRQAQNQEGGGGCAEGCVKQFGQDLINRVYLQAQKSATLWTKRAWAQGRDGAPICTLSGASFRKRTVNFLANYLNWIVTGMHLYGEKHWATAHSRDSPVFAALEARITDLSHNGGWELAKDLRAMEARTMSGHYLHTPGEAPFPWDAHREPHPPATPR